MTDDAPETIRRLKWELVPRWAEEASVGHINARFGDRRQKPTFAEAYERHRCLVLADGFYEWARIAGGKQPYCVTFVDDEPFAMAGLWTRWTPSIHQTGLDAFGDDGPCREADRVETFTSITIGPNDTAEPLHDRMAVILSSVKERAWLSGESVSFDPHPADGMHTYPVSTAVNDPSNSSPELIYEVSG